MVATKMVEAAGLEPASGKASASVPTSVAGVLFSRRPATHRQVSDRPARFFLCRYLAGVSSDALGFVNPTLKPPSEPQAGCCVLSRSQSNRSRTYFGWLLTGATRLATDAAFLPVEPKSPPLFGVNILPQTSTKVNLQNHSTSNGTSL